MLWGWFSADNPGKFMNIYWIILGCHLSRYKGLLKSSSPWTLLKNLTKWPNMCLLIMKENINLCRKLGLGQNWIYCQDNNLKSMTKVLKNWFTDINVSFMEWSNSEPKLKPYWKELKTCMMARKLSNNKDLVIFVKQK